MHHRTRFGAAVSLSLEGVLVHGQGSASHHICPSRSSAVFRWHLAGQWIPAPGSELSALQQLVREVQPSLVRVTSSLQAKVVETKIGAVSGRCPRKRGIREDVLGSLSVFLARPVPAAMAPGAIPTGREWRQHFPTPAVYLVCAPLGGAALLRTRPAPLPQTAAKPRVQPA